MGKFDFIVPDGDWDYDPETKRYIHKNLVFTEKKRKRALEAIREYVEEDIPFTMHYVPKESGCGN